MSAPRERGFLSALFSAVALGLGKCLACSVCPVSTERERKKEGGREGRKKRGRKTCQIMACPYAIEVEPQIS